MIAPVEGIAVPVKPDQIPTIIKGLAILMQQALNDDDQITLTFMPDGFGISVDPVDSLPCPDGDEF